MALLGGGANSFPGGGGGLPPPQIYSKKRHWQNVLSKACVLCWFGWVSPVLFNLEILAVTIEIMKNIHENPEKIVY
jgi:hypothetical protein